MPIPPLYRTGGEGAVASYDYTDIAEGTGNINFYLAVSAKSGPAYSYHLTKDTSFNSWGSRIGTFTGNTITFQRGATTTYTFNLIPFNLSKYIKGTALVNLFHLIYSSIATGIGLYVVATIYHVDADANATSLGTATSNTAIGTDTADTGVGVFSLPITLTQKHFKRGEYIRLVVAGTSTDPGGSGISFIGVDPANSTYTSDGAGPRNIFKTSSFVRIPFRIDL